MLRVLLLRRLLRRLPFLYREVLGVLRRFRRIHCRVRRVVLQLLLPFFLACRFFRPEESIPSLPPLRSLPRDLRLLLVLLLVVVRPRLIGIGFRNTRGRNLWKLHGRASRNVRLLLLRSFRSLRRGRLCRLGLPISLEVNRLVFRLLLSLVGRR